MLFVNAKKTYQDIYLKKGYKFPKINNIAAIDLDGTFLSTSKQISPKSLKALQLLRDHQIEPVICTQRHSLIVIRRFADLLFKYGVRFYIFNNGAIIYDHKLKKNISIYYLNYDDLAELYTFCFMNRYQIISYTNYGIFASKNAPVARTIFLYYRDFIHSYEDIHHYKTLHIYRFYIPFSLNIFHHRQPPVHIYKKYKKHFTMTSMFHGYSYNASPITKGSGLKKICEILHCNLNNTVGFGDGPNDVDLAKAANYFVAMPISDPKLVKVADVQISGNRENRFYNAVKHYLSRQKQTLKREGK